MTCSDLTARTNMVPFSWDDSVESVVSSELAQEAGEAAFEEGQAFDSHSSLSVDAEKKKKNIPQFASDDLDVGKLLGLGCFSSVHQVTAVNSKDSSKLAVKTLRRDKMNKPFHNGATDLVLEGKILQCLQHENIVELHGVSRVVSTNLSDITRYFLILEQLQGTLDQSLTKWRLFYQQQVDKTGQRNHDASLVHRRKSIALGIARGMEYLHSKHVVYRDLKPHNIGFDRLGNVKIFDFGLARDLDHPDNYYSTTYRQGRRLTAKVGTLRYMAPENVLGEPYGLPSDVYSFCVMLWELLTLKVAYETVEVEDVEEKIALGNQRPSLKKTNASLSPSVKKMLKDGWHADPYQRPTLKQVCAVLQADMNNREMIDEKDSSSVGGGDSSKVKRLKKTIISSFSSGSMDSRRKRIRIGRGFLKAVAA